MFFILCIAVSLLISSSDGGAGRGGPGAIPLRGFPPGGGGGGGRADFAPGVALRLRFAFLRIERMCMSKRAS